MGIAHVVTKTMSQEKSDTMMHQFSTFGFAFIKDQEDLGISLGYTRDFHMAVYDHLAGKFKMNPHNPAQFEYKDTYHILKEEDLWAPQKNSVKLQ